MNHFKRASSILLGTLCAIGPASATPFDFHPHAPYVGADIQERQMQYKKGYGDNLLKTTAIQGNLYTGIRLKENLGLEFGYEVTKTKSRVSTLNVGDLAAGTPITTAVAPAIFRSSVTVKGPHLDVIGFHTLARDPKLKPFASVGVAVFRVGFQRQTVQVAGALPGNIRILSKNKPILRLAAGLEYELNKHLSTRLSVGWANTSNVIAQSGDGAAKIAFKHKDTTSCGLGLLWKF